MVVTCLIKIKPVPRYRFDYKEIQRTVKRTVNNLTTLCKRFDQQLEGNGSNGNTQIGLLSRRNNNMYIGSIGYSKKGLLCVAPSCRNTYTRASFSSKVWVSTSNNIFKNLALEGWLYRHRTFKDHDKLLFLWRNNPCIVIGRHQNPWAECDVGGCIRDGVDVARRDSGGGAVYHDLGNACVTFFTKRSLYDRHANLKSIVDAIANDWPNVNLLVNNRDDILLDKNYKISGTAAKLGGKVAYHHCTLLVDINKDNLQRYLTSKLVGVDSKATYSVRSTVKNLREADDSLSWDGLVQSLSLKFFQDTKTNGKVEYVDVECEKSFPGVGAMCNTLSCWPWVYSRTPKFTIKRSFVDLSSKMNRNLDIFVEVDKGVLSDVSLGGSALDDYCGLTKMIELNLQNQPFQRNIIDDVMTECYGHILDVKSAKLYLWIWQCIKEIK